MLFTDKAKKKASDSLNGGPPISRIPHKSLTHIPDSFTTMSFGADLNIVQLVREHAPKKLQEIATQLKDMEALKTKLVAEQTELTALVNALTKKENL
jgi:hypothetical protein